MNPDPKAMRHTFHLTPDRLVIGLLSIEVLLWLADSLHWFAKGWAVLTGTASVGVALLLTLLWFAASLIIRRRFQFSVRSIFLLVLAVAIPCAWLPVEIERARRQTETVEWIMRIGGHVQYDSQYDANGDFQGDLERSGPKLLWNLLGDDFFAEITDVGFVDCQVTDAGITHLKDLKHLRCLNLSRTKITDNGLEELKGLKQLEELSLVHTSVTDRGLEHLEGMTQLNALWLLYTEVTDAGLEHLNGLNQLKLLALNDTQVSDGAVKKLQQKLPRCRITR